LPNDESKLRAVFDRLAAHGPILIVVDQPNMIGALPVTVARDGGHDVAYLPGLAMRRIADLYPGHAKTDARDAFIIADAARTMPHTRRRVDVGAEALTDLGALVGYDDLAGEATRTSNRIRGLLTGIHPALERALGPRNRPPRSARDPVPLRRTRRNPCSRTTETDRDRSQTRTPHGSPTRRGDPGRTACPTVTVPRQQSRRSRVAETG
jgi:hypothetical protein